jgi:hypothetical protein
MGYIGDLKKATKLKVNYEGNYFPIPQSVLNLGRDMTLQSLFIDVDNHPNKNGEYAKAVEHAAKECFQIYINEYLEASVPVTNPGGRHRAEKVFTLYSELMDAEKGFVKTHLSHEGDSLNDAKMRGYVLKSGVFKIVDQFLRGVLKMPKATKAAENFNDIPDSSLGTNFASGTTKTSAIGKIIINRYAQSVASIWVMAFVARFLLSMKNESVRTALANSLHGVSIGELVNPAWLHAYLQKVKDMSDKELNKIDLLETLKSLDLKNIKESPLPTGKKT